MGIDVWPQTIGMVVMLNYRERELMKEHGIHRKIGILSIVATMVAAGIVPVSQAASTNSVPMYRLYNANSGEHFYTAKVAERIRLVQVGWQDEGVGWTAPTKSKTPVYRLYNKNAGDHHYTISRGERDHLVKVGWRDEGIGWYSDDSKRTPVYRQYNPRAVTGAHNYTTNVAERRNLVSHGWCDEKIGWYAVASGWKSDGKLESQVVFREFMGQYRYSTRMGSWISDINLNSAGKFTGKSQSQYSAESGPGYAQIHYYSDFSGLFSSGKKNADGSYTLQCSAKSLAMQGQPGEYYVSNGVRHEKMKPIAIIPCGAFTAYPKGFPVSKLNPAVKRTGLNIKYNNNGELAMRVLLNNQDMTGVFWDKVAW